MSLTSNITTVNDHNLLNFERLAEVDAPPAGSTCRAIGMRTSSRGEIRVVVAIDGETGITVVSATSGVDVSRALGCWSTTNIQFDLQRISCSLKYHLYLLICSSINVK